MGMSNLISVTNAPPISRAPRQSGRSLKYATGESWNPRAEMIGYFQTLADPEKFPPVRLGGETMIQTALTTLHGIFPQVGTGTLNQSFLIHPRVWSPVLGSASVSAPYTYGASAGNFNAATVSTFQSLAAAGRVVSMKVKVYSTSSATADQGALTIGLCPADPDFLGNILTTTTLTGNANSVSSSGYPITATALATQGFNEFSSEDWTDTIPLKDGAACFWLPEDPSSLVFEGGRVRQQLLTNASTGAVLNKSTIYDPFVCVGVTGITTASTYNIEVFLNIEYTVTSGASNVVETRSGSMNTVQSFEIVKRLGGNLQNTVVPDPELSLTDKFLDLGKTVLKGGVNRLSEFVFGSSDVGKAVNNLFS